MFRLAGLYTAIFLGVFLETLWYFSADRILGVFFDFAAVGLALLANFGGIFHLSVVGLPG